MTALGGFRWSVFDLIEAMGHLGHKVFRGQYDLNLVGIRTADATSNAFNDWITVFHAVAGRWEFFAFPATTDPGVYYREHPANVAGTAIVVPGQYRGLWKIGKHRGRYAALVQVGEVAVYRDDDEDRELDATGMRIRRGRYGINLHRASATRRSTRVDKWSAGCQVVADPDHYDLLMRLCRHQVDGLGYETFSYTLLKEEDVDGAA